MEKSKIPTKGLTLIAKDKGGPYEKGADLLFCDGKRIEACLIDMYYINKASWLPMALVFFFVGCFGSIVGLSPDAEDAMLYFALVMMLITAPPSYFLLKLKIKGPQNGRISFDRESGKVAFSGHRDTEAFEIPFDMLDLHIVRFSAGKGVLYYQAYLTPTHFPEGVGKHIRYEAPFHFKSEQEAEYLWGAYATFMNKTKPIPLHFHRFLQSLMENELSPESNLKVYNHIKQQAPFYDDKTDRVIKKEVW